MPPRRRKRSRASRRRKGMPKALLLGGMIGVPVILLLGIIFLVLPFISGLSLFSGPKSSLSNTEILIDRSLPMNDPYWGGRSKLQFAQQLIGDKLLSRPSSKDASWAVRHFGGPCDGENTSLVTPFAPGNIVEAQTALAEVQVQGEVSFTQGMTAAIADLADPELFGGKINAIISVIGSGKICLPESAAATLNARMAESSNRIYVSIIGMKIPPAQRAALIEIARGMRGKIYFADNGLEVEEILNQINKNLREVMEEFKEGDGAFLQTPVPVPTPPPTATPAPTVESPPAAVEAGKTAAEPEPTGAPTQQPQEPSPTVPPPEPTASPTSEPTPQPAPDPTTGPTAMPAPAATPAPVPPPLAVPTPRPTARPPVIISNDTQALPALPVDCLSQFQPTPPATRGQTLPHVFAGTVNVDGAIAPDGIVVTARIDGLLAAVAVLKDGNYTLAVEPPLGVSYFGKKVIFGVGECQASPTAMWQTARVDRMDLTATSPP